MDRDYIEVLENNFWDIAEELDKEKGRILISSYGPWSGRTWPENERVVEDIQMHLFDRPQFREWSKKIKYWINTGENTWEREKEEHSTGLKNDREYWIRIPRDEKEDLSDWFSLEGGYEFKIKPQPNCGMNLDTIKQDEIGKVLYIPREKNIEPAFREGLEHMVEILNEHSDFFKVSEGDVENIVEYAMEDYKTGEVLQKNVRAGQQADEIYY